MSTRYVNNGDSTITDTKTGLMWASCDAAKIKSWKEAVSYCKRLRRAGYNDWRLPTIEELISIIDYSKYDPATDLPNIKLSFYWSSTTTTHITGYAWYVHFYNGYVNCDSKTYSHYVRAVRTPKEKL